MSEIPAKCLTCPNIKLVQKIIAEHELQETNMINMLLSDEYGQEIEETFNQVPQLAEVYNVETAQQLTELMRREDYRSLEKHEEHTETHRTQMAAAVLNCLGVIYAHGENEDTTVDIPVCASPQKLRDAGPVNETVVIDRQSKSQLES